MHNIDKALEERGMNGSELSDICKAAVAAGLRANNSQIMKVLVQIQTDQRLMDMNLKRVNLRFDNQVYSIKSTYMFR